MGFIFLEEEFISSRKNSIQQGDGLWQKVRAELRDQADQALTEGPWSIVFYPGPVGGDPHDYYSEAPYWWPDPANPTGPFIRKDGQFRPDLFDGHYKAFGELAKNMLFLCLAGYYLDERQYLDRAAELLRVWFLNPATAMNPHLEYGEAIPGVCPGRAAGIIVLRCLDEIIHAVTFMEGYPIYQPELNQFKAWVRSILRWLTASNHGIAERNSGNNHAVWWAVHVATAAVFTGDTEELNRIFQFYREVLVPEQMSPEGNLPLEVSRTRGLHYSLYCLDAFALLCEIAYCRGIDLWHYTRDGKSLENSIRYILPYMDNPFRWPYQQLDGAIPDERLCLQLAGVRLGIPGATWINSKRSRDCYLIRKHHPLGPTVLFPGHFIDY